MSIQFTKIYLQSFLLCCHNTGLISYSYTTVFQRRGSSRKAFLCKEKRDKFSQLNKEKDTTAKQDPAFNPELRRRSVHMFFLWFVLGSLVFHHLPKLCH